ncbi:MAG TPA: IclR family transcriptional regulator [Magnetospirillaceae bacterium]|jgi:DNA-binding IclR family transcriptional regulator
MDKEKPADKSEKSQIQVIARAAAVLRALEEEPDGLSLGEIAKRVDLARSTVQRIVGALQQEAFVMAAAPNSRVRLGPAILRMAGSVQSDFVAMAHPHLADLGKELGETVDFAVVRKDHLVFIDQITGSHRLRTVSSVGDSFPLYCTANGKAYLAQLADAEIEQLVGRQYEKRTPNTHTTLKALLGDLATVRKAGYAIDREEHTLGIGAVGVALRDPFGNAVAISVPVPSQRFYGQEKRMAERLLKAKAKLEAMIG